MIVREFSQLRCPFCFESFSALTHTHLYPDTKKTRFGILRCSCDQFPIIEGIVILRRGQDFVIEEIKQAHTAKSSLDEAIFLRELSELRLVPRRVFLVLVKFTKWLNEFWPNFFARHRETWWKFGLLVLTQSTSNSFLRAVFTYFRERDKRPTYVLISSLLASLQSAKVIIEVGGGAGHLVRDLVESGWHGELYSIEKNFWLTYWLACCGLWSKRVVPIVADVEVVLPFSNRIADVVLANDTFMYVDHQRKLAQEIHRVMKLTGWFAAIHIHRRGAVNVANGCGVSPVNLITWLQLPNWSVIDDQKFFSRLWQKKSHIFALTKNTYESLPKIGNSFSLIASFKTMKITAAKSSKYAKNQLDYLEDKWV